MPLGPIMKVLLICSAGMSTSLLARAMEKAAAAAGIALEVATAGTAELPEALEGMQVALVGPQVRHRLGQIEAMAEAAGVPVALIPAQVYGTVDGPAALEQARALAGVANG